MLDADHFERAVVAAAPPDVPVGAVRDAVAAFVRERRMQRWQVAECVTRAWRAIRSDHPTESATTLRSVRASTPESQVQTAMLRQLLRPWVHDVRRAVFGRTGRPFPSVRSAVRWLEASAARPTVATRTRLKPRYDRLLAQVRPVVAALECLTGTEWRLQETVVMLSYYRPRQTAVSHIGVARGSPLVAVKQAAGGIARVSGLTEAAVVSWILTGRAPVLTPARMSTRMHSHALPDGTAIVRRDATIEVNVRDLSYREFRGLYRALRATLEVTRVKGLTRRDVALKGAVDRRGGLPHPHPWSMGFWRSVADDVGFPTAMAALMAYRRLQGKLKRL